jgi:hypothetical protein
MTAHTTIIVATVLGYAVRPSSWEAAMALPPGTIAVANPGFDDQNMGLFAVNPADGQVTTLAQGGIFVMPWNVVFLADGRLLVADAKAFGGTGGLIAVNPDSGQQTKVSSSSLFLNPYGLALAADGQVVVTYPLRPGSHGVVMRVNPANGELRAVSLDGPFGLPMAVALDAAGNAIVTEPGNTPGSISNRLIRIDIGIGASIRADGIGANFTGVAVEPSGNLLVTDDGLGTNQTLLRFHPTSGPPTVLSQANLIGSRGRGQRRHPGPRPHRCRRSRRSHNGSAEHGHRKRPPPRGIGICSPPITAVPRPRSSPGRGAGGPWTGPRVNRPGWPLSVTEEQGSCQASSHLSGHKCQIAARSVRKRHLR